MKSKYNDKAELLFTDTDSLMYEIKTKDFFEDIKNDLYRFDNSDYPNEHTCYNVNNKKVIGKFKDEACSKQIEEFVGLRSKLYSYKLNGEEKKKCKGISMNVIKKNISHTDYLDCLFNETQHLRKMTVISSYSHDIYTEEMNKVALDCSDDKRIVLDDKINTLAYGNFKTY